MMYFRLTKRLAMQSIFRYKMVGALLAGYLLTCPFAASTQDTTFVLRDVTIYTGTGESYPRGTIAWRGKTIVYVGPAERAPQWTEPVQFISYGKDARVYPALIAPNTYLGLREYEQVRATNDYRELGEINPHIRSLIAYNAESEVIPTVRSNGVLYAQVVPAGGLVSGMSSVFALTGHNWEEAVVAADNGLHVRWPSQVSRPLWWSADPTPKPNKKYDQQRRKIVDFFQQANAWCQLPKSQRTQNTPYLAFCNFRTRGGKLFIHANRAPEIKDALQSLAFLNMPMVIVGGKDAWMIADLLKEHNVSVVYLHTHSLPEMPEDPLRLPFHTPKILDSLDIDFCLGLQGFWEQRNLPFIAGQAIADGLDYDKALRAVTSNTARILGIDHFTGSLKKDLSADFIITSGDLFDMKNSTVIGAYLRGKPVSLDDKHKQLWRTYLKKYGLN